MKLPELGVVLQVDLSAFKKIKIKIPGDYNFNKHLNAEAIEIKPRVKPEFMTMQIRPEEENNHYAALMSNIIKFSLLKLLPQNSCL